MFFLTIKVSFGSLSLIWQSDDCMLLADTAFVFCCFGIWTSIFTMHHTVTGCENYSWSCGVCSLKFLFSFLLCSFNRRVADEQEKALSRQLARQVSNVHVCLSLLSFCCSCAFAAECILL